MCVCVCVVSAYLFYIAFYYELCMYALIVSTLASCAGKYSVNIFVAVTKNHCIVLQIHNNINQQQQQQRFLWKMAVSSS